MKEKSMELVEQISYKAQPVIEKCKPFFEWLGPYITRLGSINLAGLLFALFLWRKWKRTRNAIFRTVSIICTIISIVLLLYIATTFIPDTDNTIINAIKSGSNWITSIIEPVLVKKRE